MDDKKIYWGVILKILFIAIHCIVFIVYANFRSSNIIFVKVIVTIVICGAYLFSLVLFVNYGDSMRELKFRKFVMFYQWCFMFDAVLTVGVLLLDLARIEFASLLSSLSLWEAVCVGALSACFFIISVLFFLVYLNIAGDEERRNDENYNYMYQVKMQQVGNITQQNYDYGKTGTGGETCYQPLEKPGRMDENLVLDSFGN